MELELTDGMNVEFTKDCEFQLPSYMTRLAPEDVATDTENRDFLVIAAGSDPADGKITLLTATGKVMVFDARKYYIPEGPAVPTNGGKQIFLENTTGRWPSPTPGFAVDARWMLEKSTSALTGAVLQINYPHEDKHQ